MVYKFAYVAFVIMYLTGIYFDPDFEKCWVRHIAFGIICFVAFLQLSGIA